MILTVSVLTRLLAQKCFDSAVESEASARDDDVDGAIFPQVVCISKRFISYYVGHHPVWYPCCASKTEILFGDRNVIFNGD